MLTQQTRGIVRPSTMSSTIVAMALALTALLGPNDARAQRRGAAVELVELELARGDGRGRGGRLALHYSLAHRARPDVELHLSVDGARRDRDLVAVLDHQRGWIPLGRTRRATTVTVRATDRAGRVVPMRLGRGLVVTAVELDSDLVVDRAVVERHWGGGAPRRRGRRVDDPRDRGTVPPPEGGASPRAVAAACDAAFVGSDAESECRRQMRGVPRADAIIAACDRAFVGEDATLQCVRARPVPRSVAACDRAFVGEDTTLRCVRSHASARAIAACDEMFTGDSGAARCLDIVGRARPSDAEIDEVFGACGRRIGEDEELECLEDFLGRRRRRHH